MFRAIARFVWFFPLLVWTTIVTSYRLALLTPLLSYATWTIWTCFFTYCTHDLRVTEALRKIEPRTPVPMTVVTSLISELPLHTIAVKAAVILTARFWGVYRHMFGKLLLLLDLASIAYYVYLASVSISDVDRIVRQAKVQKVISADFSVWSLLVKSITPFYVPSVPVSNYRSISYYGQEELRENSVKRMTLHHEGLLDVYSREYRPGSKRPVLLYVHGGSWSIGSKEVAYPFPRIAAERGFVVVNINYRLAPKFPMPAGFIDVKRAIVWIKCNIDAFGGDPDFIIVSGDSAGGHMAQLAAMTQNIPEWQPGHEQVDTSVRASILFAPVLDLANDLHLPGREQSVRWYMSKVCKTEDRTVVERQAPLRYLSRDMVPCLAFHGLSPLG